ncbi:MAG: thiamine pyrophosphate-dependent enzyme [Desulfobacterales bacterium]
MQPTTGKRFVCGDIFTYTLGISPSGYSVLKTVHSMWIGKRCGLRFRQPGQFGMDQPVLAVCGDSTFFFMQPCPLWSTVHHRSNIILLILDNSGTGMTGFQPHPDFADKVLARMPGVDIAEVLQGYGSG